MNVVVRKLGLIETQMALMQREFRGSTQGCQMSVLDGTLEPTAVRRAARGLFAKYRALRCAIVERDGDFSFVEHADFGRIEVDVRVLDDAGQRDRAYAEELNRELDASVALWRVLAVVAPREREAALVFSCHHSIIDGTGVMNVAEELLTLIDEVMQGIDPVVSARNLPVPIDDYLLEPNDGTYADTTVCVQIPFAHLASVGERRTAVHPVTLTPVEHQRLQDVARRNRIGLNALLGAAVVTAAVRSGVSGSPVALKTAVSLRERTQQGVNELGCYIAVADTPVEVDGATLCSLAQAYEKKLFKYIYKSCLRRKALSTSTMRERVADLAQSTSFVHGVGLTNVGEISLRRGYLHFRVKDYQAAANRNAGNNAFVVTAMSFDGDLRLPITYTEPLIERASIERVGTSLVQVLTECADSSDFVTG